MLSNDIIPKTTTIPDTTTIPERAPPLSLADLEICIPIYRYDPSDLIHQLARQRGAARAVLRIYDDGSNDPALTERISRALKSFPGMVVLMSVAENLGRAQARNALIAASSADWLLFLDADMKIDADDFLQVYQEAAARQGGGPCCIVGGFGVDLRTVTPATRLHALQSCMSECLNAATRRSEPGRFIFTSNIFLHRQICLAIPFNNGFSGWGWEDVEWGLNIVRHYPVMHIDNAAIHLGLDEDAALLLKYERSGPNFMLMLAQHPESVKRMPVYRFAQSISHFPLISALTWTTRRAVLGGRPLLPARLRLFALKLFRVSIYAQALHAHHR